MRLFLSSLSKQTTAPTEEELVIQGLTYPNPPEVGIDSGVGFSHATGNYQYAPQQYRIKDKTFITLIANTLNRTYIVVFDHYRSMVSDLIDTGLEFAVRDDHHRSSIYPNPTDPTKLFLYALDRSGTKVCKISSCGTNYDVLNWEPWTVIDSSNPERLDLAEYPHWSTALNGDVQGIFRYPTWSAKHLRTSDLINWDRIDIFYLDIEGDKRPYPLGMYPEDSGIIRVFFNYTDFDTNPSGATFPYLLYMESHDEGVTWQNIDNSFSKDVVANGAMYDDEVLNNFTAYQGTWGLGLTKAYTAMILNGRPYAICGWEDTGEPSLIYWNGSEWIINKIKIDGVDFAVTATITGQVITGSEQMFYQDGAIVAYMTEVIDGVGHMCEIRSTDNGLTWSYIEGYFQSNTQLGTYNKMSGKSTLVTTNNGEFWVKEILSSGLPTPIDGTRLMLGAGQSNMFPGQGLDSLASAEELAIQTDLKIWYQDNWEFLQVTENNGFDDKHGIELGIAKNMDAYFPDEVNHIVRYGIGGTAIDLHMPGTEYYYSCREAWRTSFGALIDQGITPHIYIFWHQGESDTGSVETVDAYTDKYLELINVWKQLYGDIPIVTMELAASSPNKILLNGKFHEIASLDPQHKVSECSSYTTIDGTHYDYDGLKGMSLLHLQNMLNQTAVPYSGHKIWAEFHFMTTSVSSNWQGLIVTDGTVLDWDVIIANEDIVSQNSNNPTFDLSTNTGRGALVRIESAEWAAQDVLEIHLSNKGIVGICNFSQCFYLPYLDLSNNNITGFKSNEYYYRPEYVDISNNQISGGVTFSKSFLTYLDISNNLFDTAYLEQQVTDLVSGGYSNGTLNILNNTGAITVTVQSAYDTLISRGWTIDASRPT